MLDPEFPLHGAADSTLLSRRTLIGGTEIGRAHV